MQAETHATALCLHWLKASVSVLLVKFVCVRAFETVQVGLCMNFYDIIESLHWATAHTRFAFTQEQGRYAVSNRSTVKSRQMLLCSDRYSITFSENAKNIKIKFLEVNMMLWWGILGVVHINLIIQTGNHVVMIHQQDHKITLGVILTCVWMWLSWHLHDQICFILGKEEDISAKLVISGEKKIWKIGTNRVQ